MGSEEVPRATGWRLVILGAIAWALGISGTRRALIGPTIILETPVGRSAWWPVALATLVLVVVLVALRDRWGWNAAAWAAGLVATSAVVSGTAGRSFGIFAALSAGIAVAGVVGLRPAPRWPDRRHLVAWWAIVPFALAQWSWARHAQPAVFGLLAVALAVVAAYHLVPEQVERWHRAVDRAITAVGGGTIRLVQTVVHRTVHGTAGLVRRTWARPGAWPLTVGVGTTMVALLPVVHRYAYAGPGEIASDYYTHFNHAATSSIIPFKLTTPFAYPAFHLTTAALSPLFGGVEGAGTFVLCAVLGTTTGVLTWLCVRPFGGRVRTGWWAGTGFALLALLIESPLIISQALHVGNPYDWAPNAHVWNSPTDILLVPIAITQLIVLGRAMRDGELDRRWARGLLAISTLAMVAKPSLSMVLVGALPLYLLASRRFRPTLLRCLGVGFYAPTLVVFVWQSWYLATQPPSNQHIEFAIEPMANLRIAGLDHTSPWFYLPPLLTLVLCVWSGGRRYWREPMIAIALWSLLVSLVPLFLLSETGRRSSDATFTKPMTMAWVVVNLLSWRFLWGEALSVWRGEPRLDADLAEASSGDVAAAERRAPAWLVVAAVLLALSLVAGALVYLEAAGWMSLPTRQTGTN